MDPNTLKDLAIVSVEGAARLGRVKEVLFATDPLRVAALQAADESGESIIPFDQVSSFGADAVMVETPQVTERSGQASSRDLRRLAEVNKLKVVDETGSYVGTVKSVDFDPQSGRVDRIVAAAGGVLGMGGKTITVEAHDVRSVGADLVTVSSHRETADATE